MYVFNAVCCSKSVTTYRNARCTRDSGSRQYSLFRSSNPPSSFGRWSIFSEWWQLPFSTRCTGDRTYYNVGSPLCNELCSNRLSTISSTFLPSSLNFSTLSSLEKHPLHQNNLESTQKSRGRKVQPGKTVQENRYQSLGRGTSNSPSSIAPHDRSSTTDTLKFTRHRFVFHGNRSHLVPVSSTEGKARGTRNYG